MRRRPPLTDLVNDIVEGDGVDERSIGIPDERSAAGVGIAPTSARNATTTR